MTLRPGRPRRARQRHLPYWVAFLSFAAIAVFFLWAEHRAHLLGALPYILLLLAVVVHILHRGLREPSEPRSASRRADDSSGGR